MRRLLPVAVLIVAAAVFTVLVLLDRPPGPTSDPGVRSLERFFMSYVQALNARDADEVGGVLGEAPGSAEVKARLERHGGRGMRDVQVSATSEFPQVYHVKLSGTYADGSSFLIAEVVEWTGTRWHLAPLPPASSIGDS